jgi:hypothetical protein
MAAKKTKKPVKKEKPEGYVFGRPAKYKAEYCQKLIDWMKEGRSFWTFASTIPCVIDTISRWTMEHKDFSEAKKIGRVLEQAWWDNVHQQIATTGEGNMTAVVWAQKNKFPKYYKERLAKGQLNINAKQQITGEIDVKAIVAAMTPEQMYQLSVALEQKTQLLEQGDKE